MPREQDPWWVVIIHSDCFWQSKDVSIRINLAARLQGLQICLYSHRYVRINISRICTCAMPGSAHCCAVWACRRKSMFSRFLSANCNCKVASRWRRTPTSSFTGFSRRALWRFNSCNAVLGSCKALGSVVPGIASLNAAFHLSTPLRAAFNCACMSHISYTVWMHVLWIRWQLVLCYSMAICSLYQGMPMNKTPMQWSKAFTGSLEIGVRVNLFHKPH